MPTTAFQQRRLCLGAAVAALFAAPLHANAAPPEVQVWKSPSCGCCQAWIDHLEAAGFTVHKHDQGNSVARRRAGIPDALGSCHTALIDGYAIEGHVPAADIKRLLAERPAAIGLAVPGMPIGSPGMDGPAYGNRQDDYAVLLVGRDGGAREFSRYPSAG